MRKHFSKEIQMNKTDPAIMKRTELANAVLAQSKEDEDAQRQAMEVLVLQTQKIQELEARIEQQQLANSATNMVPGRIPTSISTGSNNGSIAGGSNKRRNDANVFTIHPKHQARRREGRTIERKQKEEQVWNRVYSKCAEIYRILIRYNLIGQSYELNSI